MNKNNNKKRETKIFANYINGLKNLPEPYSRYNGERYYKLPMKLRDININFDVQHDIVEKIRIRRFRLGGKVCIKDRLIGKANNIAAAIPSDGYSMGSTYTVRVVSKNGNKIFEGYDNREQEYANSCHYRAVHGSVYIEISPEDFRHIHIIGGLATKINARKIYKMRVYRCEWISIQGSKKYAKPIWTSGYICNGYHSTDKKDALHGGKINLGNEKVLKHRILETDRIKRNWEKENKKALNRIYCFDDSLRAGNCRPGTEAFCRKVHISTDAHLRGKTIIALCEKYCPNLKGYVSKVLFR